MYWRMRTARSFVELNWDGFSIERGLAEFGEEGAAGGLEFGFEFGGAIAVATGPGFRAVFVATIAAGVGVLDGEEVEVFLPVGSFFVEGRGAETRFDPMGDGVLVDACLLHVVGVFVAGDGAAAEGSGVDGGEEFAVASGFDAGFDEVAHLESIYEFSRKFPVSRGAHKEKQGSARRAATSVDAFDEE